MNPIRSVLLHLDASPSSASRLAFARAVAQNYEAALSVMFVASPPQHPLTLAFSERPAALLQPIDPAAAERTRSVFDTALAEGGLPMRWLDSDGTDPVEAFRTQALYADLLVLGQRDPAAPSPGSMPSGFVESVLIGTGKPALILPFAGRFEATGRDVLIGWNETPQAARALTAALPWLRSARRVHVLEVTDEPAQDCAGELDIAQYLQLHGIVSALQRHRAPPAPVPGDAGELLLSFANEVGAGLLVMGCYGHNLAREFMLGGASRSVLQAMTLPVLMAH